jgi:hypothetical protein
MAIRDMPKKFNPFHKILFSNHIISAKMTKTQTLIEGGEYPHTPVLHDKERIKENAERK